MSEKIEIELSEETSQMLYDKYLTMQDKYESFDEYVKEVNVWLNLKMREANLKGELKELEEQISKLEARV